MSSNRPPAAPPPSLLRPGVAPSLAVAVACLCSFMVVTDGAIINVALPAIQRDLGLSAAGLQWVVDAYLLALGGFMLLAARASDLYGRRRVLQAGLLVFTLASLAGGLAASGALLLAARALQGLGASALATSTLALIASVHPPGPARGRAISAWAASSAVASAVGVTLGGLLTAHAGWRWVMTVNVPIGAGLMLLVAHCFTAQPPAATRPRLDVPGAATVTLASGSLMFGLSQSVAAGWSSPQSWGPLLLAAVFALAFVRIESRSALPLIRLGVFGQRNVQVGNLVVLCLGAALTASGFFTSLALQHVLGYDAQQAGLAMLPMGLALAVAAIAARALMDAGVRFLPFVGGTLGAVGLAWMARLPQHAAFAADLLGPTLMTGAGLGLMLMTATHTAIDGLPPADAGLASGLFNTARQLGAALGIAALLALAHFGSQQAGGGALAGLLAGYRMAFGATAALALLAGLASLLLRRAPAA